MTKIILCQKNDDFDCFNVKKLLTQSSPVQILTFNSTDYQEVMPKLVSKYPSI